MTTNHEATRGPMGLWHLAKQVAWEMRPQTGVYNIQWYHLDFSLFDLFGRVWILTIRFCHEVTRNWMIIKEKLSLNHPNGKVYFLISFYIQNGTSSGVHTHMHTISQLPNCVFVCMLVMKVQRSAMAFPCTCWQRILPWLPFLRMAMTKIKALNDVIIFVHLMGAYCY